MSNLSGEPRFETKGAHELSIEEEREIIRWEESFQYKEPPKICEKHPSVSYKLVCTNPVTKAKLYRHTTAAIGRNNSDNSIVAFWLNSVKKAWVSGKQMDLQFGYNARINLDLRRKHLSETIMQHLLVHTLKSCDPNFTFSTAGVQRANVASVRMSIRTGNRVIALRNIYLYHCSSVQQTSSTSRPVERLTITQATELWRTVYNEDNGCLVDPTEILSKENHVGVLFTKEEESWASVALWDSAEYSHLQIKDLTGNQSTTHKYLLVYNILFQGVNGQKLVEQLISNVFSSSGYSYFVLSVWDIPEFGLLHSKLQEKAVSFSSSAIIARNVNELQCWDGSPFRNPFSDPRDGPCSLDFDGFIPLHSNL
jgi:hypothetical protein